MRALTAWYSTLCSMVIKEEGRIAEGASGEGTFFLRARIFTEDQKKHEK